MISRRVSGVGLVVLAGAGVLACSSDEPAAPSGPGPAAQLAVQPVSPMARTDFSLQVQIQDAAGVLVPTATNNVTLALANNPGNLLWHASGRLGNEILEQVDPREPAVLTGPNIAGTYQDEISALSYDAQTGMLVAGDIDANYLTIDPATGIQTIVGPVVATGYLGGLAFEQGGSAQLLGVMQSGGDLFSLNQTTGEATSLGALTLTGETINGGTGLATDPTSGIVYGVLKLASLVNPARALVTINPSTLGVMNVGTLSEDGIADIAFLSDGTLVGVTGDGATNPETLWTIDKTNGAATQIIALGNGADGEAIAAVPATFTGTMTVAAVNGIATFPGLQIDAVANGYTITASATGLTSGTSAAINVTP